MHAARGGWLGQTFALAKHDDSFDGKKSGIRRSKEERKGMIETFIKRYQKSNNGDFPSLNLTRKEVGGSFYTVREIVREIIQENRVLGPPKSPPGDLNMENLDSFLEHHPAGSMSVDPPQETQTQHESEFAFICENGLNSMRITELHQGNNEAFKNLKNTELLMEGNLGEQKNEVHEIVGNGTQYHQILEGVDKKSEEDTAHPLQQSESTLASQKEQDPSSAKENLVFHVNGGIDVKHEDTLLAEQKTINGANAPNLHSKTSCNPVQEPTLEERLANLNQSSGQPPSANPQNRTTTLNRLDLKSWKAVSKTSNGRETHQVVKFIRSFITAFVKFWSE
ncbi:hypothetical protein M8C21_010672 [Ambrosia artemisiifolia]|uniref:AT3G52170-like helix-turn-helix domain-containing protein n=1 Tax=Ambrosia artemisiifolia TaxID=4212 RepID=A0AAD5G8W6_AMBAR|nr:hypothetical protein M8C21_010672 [Ambrosia artemisiifolia]